ncbi:MAG: hypothetical protein ACXAB7_04810 [Candidatus Kariarchaeaceae archaeon]|jgi:hypothetical protein
MAIKYKTPATKTIENKTIDKSISLIARLIAFVRTSRKTIQHRSVAEIIDSAYVYSPKIQRAITAQKIRNSRGPLPVIPFRII